MTGISTKTIYAVAALHELASIQGDEVLKIKEIAALSDVCKTDNPTLKLFWEDIREGVLSVFDIPLSELKNYQQTAEQTLNYTI